MDGRTRAMRVFSWILLGVAVAISVGGLIYDGTRPGEAPDMSGFYFIAVVLAMAATMLGYEVRHRTGGGRRD